ncbi:unnamed protein product, partial [Cylicostephanus goldi]
SETVRNQSRTITKVETPTASCLSSPGDVPPTNTLSQKRERFAKGIKVFKHDHRTYLTCFGAVHVKATTCFAGVNVLIGICCILFYCVFTSQEVNFIILIMNRTTST